MDDFTMTMRCGRTMVASTIPGDSDLDRVLTVIVGMLVSLTWDQATVYEGMRAHADEHDPLPLELPQDDG